jgi:hypothetical protein
MFLPETPASYLITGILFFALHSDDQVCPRRFNRSRTPPNRLNLAINGYVWRYSILTSPSHFSSRKVELIQIRLLWFLAGNFL